MSLDDLLDNYASKGGAPRLKSEFRSPSPVQAPAPTPAPAPATTPAPPVPEPTSGATAEYYFAIGGSGGSAGELRAKEPELISRVYSCKNGVPGSTNGALALMPQRTFQPIGITLFGCDSNTLVSCNVGHCLIFGDIYGMFFEETKSDYKDLITRVPSITKANWMPSFELCTLGTQIVVRYWHGTLKAFVVWGHDVEIV